jgi:flagellar biosynthesis chaperone FliJ
MRRFRFRLESVRSLREHDETAAQAALARELAVGRERAKELAEADAALASARGATIDLTAAGLAAQQAYVERRERERRVAALAAAAQEDVVTGCADELRAATAQRAALDRLRDRKLASHRLESARADELTLGEVALASRRRQEEAA